MNWLTKFFYKPTLFVQIASYRDPECQWTVRDLFEKASHPERIHVGICGQYDPEADKHCFLRPSPRPEQTRIKSYRPEQSLGICWARAEAQSLYQGEDYVLMIDSHMRFVPGWDTALIRELKRCPSKKPFISTYPPGYKPPNQLELGARSIVLRPQPFNTQGDIRFVGEVLRRPLKKPLRGSLIAGGFIFAPGQFIRDVPTDPHIYFDQDEITHAVRAFTHGWDVFSPSGTYVYHYYYEPQKGEKRATHWADNPKWTKIAEISRARYNWLLVGIQPAQEAETLMEMDRYGLGKERTLQEFEAFAGIDFRNRQIVGQVNAAATVKPLTTAEIVELLKIMPKPAV